MKKTATLANKSVLTLRKTTSALSKLVGQYPFDLD
jgi:hypothetical protein